MHEYGTKEMPIDLEAMDYALPPVTDRNGQTDEARGSNFSSSVFTVKREGDENVDDEIRGILSVPPGSDSNAQSNSNGEGPSHAGVRYCPYTFISLGSKFL